MAIDPRASVLDALATYLGTELSGLTVRRGWPEDAVEVDLAAKPELAVTAGPSTVELCSPDSVSEAVDGGTVTVGYRVGYLRMQVQLDLWATYRAQRDAQGALVEAALHNQVPFGAGLWLTQADHFGRPITATVTESRIEDDASGAPRGQWRQSWTLDVLTDVVVHADHPLLTQVDVDLTTVLEGVTVVEPTTSVT